MLTLTHSRPFSIGFIGYNGGFIKGEIQLNREAYLKFNEGIGLVIALLIWIGEISLTIKEIPFPPAIKWTFDVSLIIFFSLLYGYANLNWGRSNPMWTHQRIL